VEEVPFSLQEKGSEDGSEDGDKLLANMVTKLNIAKLSKKF